MAKSKRTAKMEKEYWAAQNKENELRAENETLRLANENLRCILEENGIRPHQLLVTYYDVDCYNCDCYSGDEGDQEWEECYYRRCDEECPKRRKWKKSLFIPIPLMQMFLLELLQHSKKKNTLMLLV